MNIILGIKRTFFVRSQSLDKDDRHFRYNSGCEMGLGNNRENGEDKIQEIEKSK